MKTLYEYLAEATEALDSKKEGTVGTYAKLTLDLASTKRLLKFCADHNIDSIPEKDYHVTLAFSRPPVPEIADYPIHLPISAHVSEYKIFPTANAPGKNSLVVILESKYLQHIFTVFTEEYGASWDWDEFMPHVTLTYDWPHESVPKEIPHLALTLNKFVVEDLNLDWKPSDDNGDSVTNLSEEIITENDIFEMSNLRKNETGLPVTIWISSKASVSGRHGPRIKIMLGTGNHANMSQSVSIILKKDITQEDVIGYSHLSNELVNKIRSFINLNYSTLMRYWNFEISTKEMSQLIKPIT